MVARRRIDLVALAVVAAYYGVLGLLIVPWVVIAVMLWRWVQ